MGPLPKKKPRDSRGAATRTRALAPKAVADIIIERAAGSKLPVPDLDDVEVVWGTIKHMPKMADIPPDFFQSGRVFFGAISSWFFRGAIFGNGDGQFRTQRVRVIQHGPEIADCSDVPAEIPVVTDRVSRPDDDVTRLDIGDCAAHMRR